MYWRLKGCSDNPGILLQDIGTGDHMVGEVDKCKAIIKWPKQVTTALVEQLIKAERNVEKALIEFDSASAEYAHGFRHDEKTYEVIVMKLLYANEFRRVEDIVERMRKDECKVTD
ncbi:hypothetical protein Tco_1432449, partial [Tanacetum coccineum]